MLRTVNIILNDQQQLTFYVNMFTKPYDVSEKLQAVARAFLRLWPGRMREPSGRTFTYADFLKYEIPSEIWEEYGIIPAWHPSPIDIKINPDGKVVDNISAADETWLAVKAYLVDKAKDMSTYPYANRQPTDKQIEKIAQKVNHHDNLDEIHAACLDVLKRKENNGSENSQSINRTMLRFMMDNTPT